MEADYERRGGTSRSYWIRPTIHGNRPLLLEHYYLAFLLFVAPTAVSVIAFATELCFGRKGKRRIGDGMESRKKRGPELGVRREVLEGITKEDRVVEIKESVPREAEGK